MLSLTKKLNIFFETRSKLQNDLVVIVTYTPFEYIYVAKLFTCEKEYLEG